MRKNDLRLWAVWDPVISRIEMSSESQSACRHLIDLFAKNGRTGFQLLRFDLSPIYYDLPCSRDNASSLRGFSISGEVPVKQKTKTQK